MWIELDRSADECSRRADHAPHENWRGPTGVCAVRLQCVNRHKRASRLRNTFVVGYQSSKHPHVTLLSCASKLSYIARASQSQCV
mmetsp:Transcript_5598/g.16027  ORF Transcript_5598/g.16027 Transcript_5598/m.16027 type:complete len:85 (-) Transcript_5598:131-385(-)